MMRLRNTATGEVVNVDDDRIVADWRAGKEGIADEMMGLPEPARKAILVRLGYDTPSHLAMFGL
jgi:hypothetical protein